MEYQLTKTFLDEIETFNRFFGFDYYTKRELEITGKYSDGEISKEEMEERTLALDYLDEELMKMVEKYRSEYIAQQQKRSE